MNDNKDIVSAVSCESGVLCVGETAVANFGIGESTALLSPNDPDQLEAVRIWLSPPISRPSYVVLDMKEGPLVKQVLNRFPECKLLARAVGNIIDAYLMELARQSYLESDCAGLYFREQGLYHLGGTTWVMVCGDKVLGDCGGFVPELPQSAKSIRLAWDETIPAQEAVVRLIRRMADHQTSIMPAYAFTMLSSLRSEIMKRSYLSTFPLLSVVGPQNFGKTRLVTTYCLLYDNAVSGKVAAKLASFSTESGLVAAAASFRDLVVLIDDLGIGSHASVTQQALKTMNTILKYAANDNERSTSTSSRTPYSQECKAGIAFTGEIPFTAESDRSRVIPIHLDSPLRDGEAADRTIAATAFWHWLNWFLNCADQQFKSLDQRLAEAPQVVHARLQTTYILMAWVLESFYQFAQEMGCISESVLSSAIDSSNKALLSILERQIQDSRTSGAPLGNLAFYILKGYEEDAFHVVSSRKKISKGKDCVIENGALCITVETLCSYINRKTPYYIGERKLGKELQKIGVCPDYEEGRTAGKRIKVNGKMIRYLELNFHALRKVSERYKSSKL